MSHHVFISLEKFEESPISIESWHKVAREISVEFPGLVLKPSSNRLLPLSYSLHLRGNKAQNLHRTPHGLILAQEPSEELVAVIFILANKLHAKVYSERFKEYTSVKNWKERTEKYTGREVLKVKQRKFTRARKLLLWVFFILGIVLLGPFIGKHS
ncbi:MAG: hypothetical protein EOO52_07085 [Gammaproteobacteria bacterium]|nr:MAG: hypothetical protein EOO52_07085 [Gammaproteobacteria bacterium]